MFVNLFNNTIFARSLVGLLLSVLVPTTALATGGLLTTKHNLSTSGPGDIKATQEERVCIFCHTPHHANPVTPLWSRPTSSTVYDLYQSTTLIAKPGQPTGASRLCLSCHDGTVALGALYGLDGAGIQMVGGMTTLPADRPSNLMGSSGGLNNDHPISFAYTDELAQSNGQLASPGTLSKTIRLEGGVVLQCNSCHNPHRDPYGMFLVVSNDKSALCISCHTVTGWSESGHALNKGTETAGCGNCHSSHNGKRAMRLLKKDEEEQNCLPCHKQGGSCGDIASELDKPYSHPVSQYKGTHDEAEDPLTVKKHVECEDCHNPHQAKSATASAPAVNGSLLGVKGVTSSKTTIPKASYEYEVCFRCHADNNFVATQAVVRRIQELNSRYEFDSLNPSYHPVTAQGVGHNVPSLRTGYSTASMIYCTDCHGSDDAGVTGVGGITGARGPHGSRYPHILAARYEIGTYPLSYDDKYYMLCYRCHDQTVLLDPLQSAFPKHNLHVRDHGIPCYVCHDSHGVSRRGLATPKANAHLINFDSLVVTSGDYDSVAKTCDVSCHSATYTAYADGLPLAKRTARSRLRRYR